MNAYRFWPVLRCSTRLSACGQADWWIIIQIWSHVAAFTKEKGRARAKEEEKNERLGCTQYLRPIFVTNFELTIANIKYLQPKAKIQNFRTMINLKPK